MLPYLMTPPFNIDRLAGHQNLLFTLIYPAEPFLYLSIDEY